MAISGISIEDRSACPAVCDSQLSLSDFEDSWYTAVVSRDNLESETITVPLPRPIGAKAVLTGWTHSLWDFHRGVMNNKVTADAYATVQGLKPNHPYSYAVYQYVDDGHQQIDDARYDPNLAVSVQGAPAVEVAMVKDSVEPTLKGMVVSDASGKIVFKFSKNGWGHMAVSGISIEDRSECSACVESSLPLSEFEEGFYTNIAQRDNLDSE